MAEAAKTARIEAAKAKMRFVRVAPRKLRLVADLIRGKTVSEAQDILKFTFKPSATPHINRLLKSAVANARQNDLSDPESLVIGEIQVDSGPMMKRLRPRAYGSAARIRKRSSHVSLVLTER